MILLCCTRTFASSAARMTVYSNFRKFSNILYNESLKPVKVNSAKLNVNCVLKRHYLRPNIGERSREEDSMPKGFELIYKEKHPSLLFTALGVAYFIVGYTVWQVIDKYVLKNPNNEGPSTSFLNPSFTAGQLIKKHVLEDEVEATPLTHTKFDPILGFIVAIVITISLFKFALRAPFRIYRRNDEIVAVLNGFLGPLKKRVMYCRINDIQQIAPVPLLPFRMYEYSVNGKRIYMLDFNFRCEADLNQINSNDKLRTKLNDIVDALKKWSSKWINKNKD